MRMLSTFKHVEWATVSTEYTHSDNTTDKRKRPLCPKYVEIGFVVLSV